MPRKKKPPTRYRLQLSQAMRLHRLLNPTPSAAGGTKPHYSVPKIVEDMLASYHVKLDHKRARNYKISRIGVVREYPIRVTHLGRAQIQSARLARIGNFDKLRHKAHPGKEPIKDKFRIANGYVVALMVELGREKALAWLKQQKSKRGSIRPLPINTLPRLTKNMVEEALTEELAQSRRLARMFGGKKGSSMSNRDLQRAQKNRERVIIHALGMLIFPAFWKQWHAAYKEAWNEIQTIRKRSGHAG